MYQCILLDVCVLAYYFFLFLLMVCPVTVFLSGSYCEAQKCMIGHFAEVFMVATISEFLLDKPC